jgi:hypothetical protein
MHRYTTRTTGHPTASGERSNPYWLTDPTDPTDPLCAPAATRRLRYLTSKGRLPVAVRVEDPAAGGGRAIADEAPRGMRRNGADAVPSS